MKKMTTHHAFKARMMKRPGVRKSTADIAPEFFVIRAILDARTKQGMSQAVLARKVGTKQSAIARFEAGGSNPTMAFTQKLLNALDLRLIAVPRR